MFDFIQFTQNIKNIKTQEDFSHYLESCFAELETFFDTLTSEALNDLKFDIEDLLYDLEDQQLVLQNNAPIINAFLILLAQKFESAGLIGAITNILNYLPECGVKKRLEATKLYLKVNDLSKDYFDRFEQIASLISSSFSEEESPSKAIKTFCLFYLAALAQFVRVNNSSLALKLKNLFIDQQNHFPLLKNTFILDIVSHISIENYPSNINAIRAKIDTLIPLPSRCHLISETVMMEEGNYAQKLRALSQPSFEKLREIAFSHIQSIGDPDILYEQLLRGEAIIDKSDLLYKYMVSFGTKHKAKLYSAFDVALPHLQRQNVNIVDWGCGQALATTVLMNYLQENRLDITIKNICLLEPSMQALSRGLLHVDIFKTNQVNVKAINSDFDCFKQDELFFDKAYTTIHLFSNVLDLEGFMLNNEFFQKVSSTVQNDSIFICVSPSINDKRNTRLDLFYKYFDENFDTTLLSSRNSDVFGHKRYEKIFRVNVEAKAVSCEQQQLLSETSINSERFNLLTALNQYHNYIAPILDAKKIEESLVSDPEYLIFKVRKIAEILTTKIYSTFESNAESISFSDKIKYLSYQKKVFSKSISNYLHTIRTIGNRGVHDDRVDISKLKLDAHLMIYALLNLLYEFQENKLLL